MCGFEDGTYLVDLTFFWSCRRCPLAVARDFGRCLWTKSEVRPGQVEKKPESMACVQVLTTRLKAARCRYWTRSAFVVISCALDACELSG